MIFKRMDRIRFIQSYPGRTDINAGDRGCVINTQGGGYLIELEGPGDRRCIVGNIDAAQLIEKITNLKIAPGQKYRIIKESPVDFFKDKARLGDVFEILGSKMLGDHEAWGMLNISDNERHGAVITALEKEFDEYLAPVGATVARQVPAALQNWIKQVEPHLVRR